MSKITIQNLSFSYEGSWDEVFHQISFQIDTDWKLGFVARNGRGKTTFLKLLEGELLGVGEISASVKFQYFPYEVKDKTKTAVEIAEQIFPFFEFWKLSRELNYLEFDQEGLFRPFETLSYGEQSKVLLALLFIQENDFLLIDEPTNHLDISARRIISEYLNGKKGFLLVSHDREFLDGCIDHVLAINKESITVTRGNFQSWWENKERQDNYEWAENQRLQKDIGRLERASRQSSSWADKVESTKIGKKSNLQEKHIDKRAYIGEKSRRMQQRRKNLERRMSKELEEKRGLLKNVEQMEELKVFPLSYHKEVLVEGTGLSLFYGEKKVLGPVDIQIRGGERIGILGKNGCGKSTLLKKIAGEKISAQGQWYLAPGLKISYVSQDTEWLKGTLDTFIEEQKVDAALLCGILRKLDFERSQFEKPLEDYSKGQKKKVLLARSLCHKAHLYIWDEPLNYIDVFSRMQLEKLLAEFAPTMLLVEHDRRFMQTVTTRTFLL